MSIKYWELSDGKYLGLRVLEVISFPNIADSGKGHGENCEKVSQQFMQLLTEVHKLAGDNLCVELLWITEKVYNQTFTSKIRIFSVLRKIGKNKAQIEYELYTICQNLLTAFATMQFQINESDGVNEELQGLLEKVNDSCTYGIVKREVCTGNSNSIYPYYYAEVIPNKNSANFSALVATLSQYENCCISFQLFPTQLTQEELYIVNEMVGELGRISSGFMMNGEMYQDALALEPLKVYNYYNEHKNDAFFQYNMLIFGEKAYCASLAAKLVSLIQYGNEKIVTSNPICIDLSAERVSLLGQFPHYVWNINTRLLYYYRNAQLQNAVPIAKQLFRLPHLLTAGEAVAFYRLPLYENNMPALRENQMTNILEQFSGAVVNETNIKFGKLAINESAQINIGCSEKAFTKHALIVGTPGSGKTTFSINLLLQFAKRGIPFLAIEPTKSEYRAMIETIPDLRIFTPGNNGVSPYIMNPFIPPKGVRVEQYIPSLASAFKAAFSMPSPLDMIFLKAIRMCYIQYGWKDYSVVGDSDVKVFGVYEFILVFKKLIENTNYSKEVRGNLESAGLLRLMNLIEQNSNIYDTVHTIPIEDILSAPTVLELNSIDNAEQKALIMALLLINICIYTKQNQAGDGELKNVILIDEAHVLLGSGNSRNAGESADSQGATIKALQDMIAEIRSYGTSIIIADQSPTKVSREVVANTDIKISFRLVQSMEKELIADSTNMDERALSNLSKLKTGEAYVYYSQLDTPQMIITEDIREKEGIRLSVSDKEVVEKSTYWNSHKELLRPYAECVYCKQCQKECDFYIRANAEFIANCAFNRYRGELKSEKEFKKCVFYLPNLMKSEFHKYQEMDVERLQTCSKIKLIRKITLELSIGLSDKEIEYVLTNIPQD